jgi:hypothetical protein
MKIAIDLNGNKIEVADDVTVKTVNGVHYLLTPEEQGELDVRNAAWSNDSVARNAKVKILQLELEITPRRIREAVLGTDNGWLANQQNLIQIERNKLGD